jgi:pimeloyl-ACP methyl ester carboxylesterase
MFNLVRDAMGLLAALGLTRVGVVGHDFGSPVAAWCALLRPDIFSAVALMSAPFDGPPALPAAPPRGDIHADLADLPRPRKHSQWYYSTRAADRDMLEAPQGLHDFLRAYYHVKSADWAENRPEKLAGYTAADLARLPTYYIMDLRRTMAETVAGEMPPTAPAWLTEDELRVYSAEFGRTGFQGGLNWYRCRTGGTFVPELQLMAGRTIDVPSLFLAGRQDWGVYQVPGAFERMQATACTRMAGCHLIEGAGHWVQQEQPEQVAEHLIRFFKDFP